MLRRHRGSRGSRAGFITAGASESKAEQLLISQMQTPERHRAGQGSYLVASPLPNLGSPVPFASPNPVPLFQPSPKRHGLPSPGHQGGFEALFMSPTRGFSAELQAAAELLRFETPSRHPAQDSLISPSPSRVNRRLAPGSQGRRSRQSGSDTAGWKNTNDSPAFNASDDADFDLIRKFLQSPGPKVGVPATTRPTWQLHNSRANRFLRLGLWCFVTCTGVVLSGVFQRHTGCWPGFARLCCLNAGKMQCRVCCEAAICIQLRACNKHTSSLCMVTASCAHAMCAYSHNKVTNFMPCVLMPCVLPRTTRSQTSGRCCLLYRKSSNCSMSTNAASWAAAAPAAHHGRRLNQQQQTQTGV